MCVCVSVVDIFRHSRVYECKKTCNVFQLADIIGFVNVPPELTNGLETEIASLTTRVASLSSRTVEVQGRLLGF